MPLENFVETIKLAQAEEHLPQVLKKLEMRREVSVIDRGRTLAKLSSVIRRKKPLPLEELAAFRARMPRLSQSAVDLIREIRDEGY